MAKVLLKFFGLAALLTGVIAIAVGVANAKDAASLWLSFYAGSGALLFGASLLGFAKIIDLLERIAANTEGLAPIRSPSDPLPGNLSKAGVTKQETYKGYAFTVHEDGKVVSRINGAPYTWRNEPEFKAFAEARPSA
ncbi:hypothetical protein [Methylobacterium sp. D54C]